MILTPKAMGAVRWLEVLLTYGDRESFGATGWWDEFVEWCEREGVQRIPDPHRSPPLDVLAYVDGTLEDNEWDR